MGGKLVEVVEAMLSCPNKLLSIRGEDGGFDSDSEREDWVADLWS